MTEQSRTYGKTRWESLYRTSRALYILPLQIAFFLFILLDFLVFIIVINPKGL